jgi:hypothetical protein
VYPVFPFPGTEMYRVAKGQNLLNLDENDFDTMRQRIFLTRMRKAGAVIIIKRWNYLTAKALFLENT